MEYVEKVAAYEDAIMEKIAALDARDLQTIAVSSALLGGAGGGVGALYGLLKKKDKDDKGNEISRADMVRKYTKAGLALGGVAGTAVGAKHRFNEIVNKPTTRVDMIKKYGLR